VSDTQARLDAIREAHEFRGWVEGSDVAFLLAELERVTAALRDETVRANTMMDVARHWKDKHDALAGAARAAQEDK
jgi:hypothetical protein